MFFGLPIDRRFPNLADRRGAGFFDILKGPGADGRQQRRAVGRSLLAVDRRHLAAEYIGLDLPPERAARSAAGGPNPPHRHAQPLKYLQTLAHRIRHALHDRSHQMSASVCGRQTDETAACVGVGVRGPLAGKVRQKEQPLAADRCFFRFLGQQVVDFSLGAFCRRLVRLAECVAEPLQRSAGREVHAHHVPAAADGVAEGMYAPQRVDLHLVAVDEHHAGGADRGGEDSAGDDAVSDRSGGAVARPGDHHAIGGQPKQLRRLRGELAGDVLRFTTLGQQVGVQFQGREEFFRPSAPSNVQQQHAAGVAHVGCVLSGQPAADFILRQQHFARGLEMFRLVVSQPEDFRGGESG